MPPGTSALIRAVQAMAMAKGVPTHPTREASVVLTTATRAALTPRTVAGATKGAATRLARTATRLTLPWRRTMTGPQTSWAASGIATAGPTTCSARGSRALIAADHGRTKMSSPSVASVESTKP